MTAKTLRHEIHCLDLKKQYLAIKRDISHAFLDVCQQTAFSGGPFVDKFEKEFADYCGLKHCQGVNSGTSALHLALMALNIKTGDEVIVPANTFIATAWAPVYINAKPVFVDCSPDTWNIAPALLEKKITPATKAIIGVHLYGQPFDITAVLAIARKHNIPMIEDCAQAHGARYKGTHVGSFGALGCFSFYPGKNLGAYGEGGAVVTNNSEYASRINSLRNHGSTTRYYHDEIGYNYRMDGLQAAVLSVKLKHLEAWNQRRRDIAAAYHSSIKNPKIKMQVQPPWAQSSYHLFVVTIDNRNSFLEHLRKHGINAGQHYPVPCHLQKAFAHMGYQKGDCPNAEYLANHCLSLPMYPELENSEVSTVIKAVNSF